MASKKGGTMNVNPGLSLRTRLLILVLMVFIPLGVLVFFTAEEQRQIEKETIFKGVKMLAEAAAIEEQQQLDEAQNILMFIADLYSVKDQRDGCIAKKLMELKKRFPALADLGIMDENGQFIAGVRSVDSYGGYHRKFWFVRSVQRDGLTMGDYRKDTIDGVPVLYLALPVPTSMLKTKNVVFAALDLAWMNRATFKLLEHLPLGAKLYLIDDTGGILCYDSASKDWFHPDRLGAPIIAQITSGRSGIMTADNLEGEPSVFAFTLLNSPIKDRQRFVTLELQKDKALAISSSVFKRNMAVLVLFGLLAAFVVWWSGDVFIIKRVRKMMHASRAIASGDLTARVGNFGGHDELSQLAGVFDTMATALQDRQARERKAMATLDESRQQLRRLAAHQQEVRENERIRIARELHDEFGQSLTILKMDLAWVKKQLSSDQAESKKKISEMSQIIDASLQSLHSVMAQLRPVILDDFGLAAALEWQAEDFQNRTGISCHVSTAGFTRSLPKELATTVFRIYQELLTNVVRHAESKNVQITLAEQSGQLVLKIVDDGCGITETQVKAPRSYGLVGIRERLYSWNGQVVFQGQAGQGTVVTIKIPLKIQERKGD